jgi:hypothetical protein
LLTHELPGFVTKVKKILESVCHNCGKILDDEVCYLAY